MNMRVIHKYSISVLWCFCTLFCIYFVVYALAKKGVNLTDHGFYLFYAQNFFNNVPTSFGLSSFVNAIPMLLGIKSYLFFERYFFITLLIIGLLFYFSLRLPKKASYIAPFAIIMLIAPTWTQMFSYQTVPVSLLLLACGILFCIENYEIKSYLEKLLYVLIGIFFTYSSVSNLSLLPSILINWILIVYFFRNANNKWFNISYWLSGVILSTILVQNVFSSSAVSQSELFSDNVVTEPTYIIYTTTIVVSIIFSSALITYVLKNYFSSEKTNFIVIALSLLIFYILTFYWANYQFWSYINTLGLYGLVIAGIFIVSCYTKTHSYKQLVFAFILQLEYLAALLATGGSYWVIRLNLHGGMLMIINFLLLANYLARIKNYKAIKALIYVLVILTTINLMKFQLTYAYGADPESNTYKITSINKLNNIYVDKGVNKAFSDIGMLYKTNDCSNKTFLEWAISPLFYYLYNIKPFDADDIYLHPALAMLDKLKSTPHWCFLFDGLSFDFVNSPILYGYLKKHSKKAITLSLEPNVPNGYPSKFVFFVK